VILNPFIPILPSNGANLVVMLASPGETNLKIDAQTFMVALQGHKADIFEFEGKR